MWQWVIGVVLLLHGLIHLMGVAVYWRLAELEGLRYPAALLGGALAAPPAAVQALGGLWLAATVGFAAAAAGLLLGQAWWPALLVGTAGLSLALGALAWPDAWAGVVINALILAAMLGARFLTPAPA
jgi:hypothetical protein